MGVAQIIEFALAQLLNRRVPRHIYLLAAEDEQVLLRLLDGTRRLALLSVDVEV